MSSRSRASEREPWFLGIDLGTGSCKSVVIDARARVLGFGVCAYRSAGADDKWKEQDPEALVDAMVRSVRAAVSSAVEKTGVSPDACGGLSLAGAYHSLIALDRAGAPLTGLVGLGQAVGQSGLHRPKAETPIDGLLLVGIDAGGGEGMGVHQSVQSAVRVANQVSDAAAK